MVTITLTTLPTKLSITTNPYQGLKLSSKASVKRAIAFQLPLIPIRD